MKPIITTGGSSSRQARQGAPAQPMLTLPFLNLEMAKRAPTTICSFSSNRVHLVMRPRGDMPKVEGCTDATMGESSPDACETLPAEKEGNTASASSWQQNTIPKPGPTFSHADEHSSGSSATDQVQVKQEDAATTVADEGQMQREETPVLAPNLKLKLRKVSLKPRCKTLEAHQRPDRRRNSKREAAPSRNFIVTETQDQLQSQMDGMAATNLELQQSASAARGELEALRAQVQSLQGSLREGESENGRLQAELGCLRQSLQLNMGEGRQGSQGAEEAPLHHIFADFDYGDRTISQDCMDFGELASDFLFSAPA